jgi:hypothetical protein
MLRAAQAMSGCGGSDANKAWQILGTGTILMMTAAGLTARVLVSPQKS